MFTVQSGDLCGTQWLWQCLSFGLEMFQRFGRRPFDASALGWLSLMQAGIAAYMFPDERSFLRRVFSGKTWKSLWLWFTRGKQRWSSVVSVVFKGVSIFHIDHTDIDVQTWQLARGFTVTEGARIAVCFEQGVCFGAVPLWQQTK